MASLFPTAKHDPELHPFRPGLVFAFFNALNWQVGAGTPTVLFMEHIGANSFEVGLVFAWTYLLTPVQVFATVLLPKLGCGIPSFSSIVRCRFASGVLCG